jgi:hypothetical protein
LIALEQGNKQQFLEESHKLSDYIGRINPKFEQLNDRQKFIATQLLRQGKEGAIRYLSDIIYDKPPQPIEEFLCEDNFGIFSHMLFPLWKDTLCKDVFSHQSQVYEIVFSGSTGSGKTSIALVAHLYNLYRILLMKQPQIMYGVLPSQLLAIIFITVSLEKAAFAMMRPFVEMLRTCNLFHEVKKEEQFRGVMPDKIPFVDDDDKVIFPKNTIVFAGSQEFHTISMTLVGGFLDEAEFRIGDVEKAFQLYLTIRERLRNRFVQFIGRRSLLLTLVSSSKGSEGVIPKYTHNIKPNDPNTKIYAYSIWEVRNPRAFDKGYFYVLRGTKTIPSKILSPAEKGMYETDEYKIPPSCEVIKVPEDYRQDFETGVERALRNVAGVQTLSDEDVFYNLEVLEKPDERLTPSMQFISNLGDDVSIYESLLRTGKVFKTYGGKVTKLRRYPDVFRYVHLDLAEVNVGGLCVLHKEMDGEGIILVVDLLLKLVSSSRIDFEQIEQFLVDLKTKANVSFRKITADQYQSTQMLQKCKKLKLAKEVVVQSVDKTLEPYYRLANTVGTHRLKIGNCSELYEQAKALKIREGKLYTMIRKDLLDSLCGSTTGAIVSVDDQPIYQYRQDLKIVDSVGLKRIF